MGELKLVSDFSPDTTMLSNIYIDEYMPANNESQIKIYLYLLRRFSAGMSVSVSAIADVFNYSVQDVERALLFMERQGLMSLEGKNGSISGLRLLPLQRKMCEKSCEKGNKVMDFKPEPDNQQIVFVAEQYAGRTLNKDDVKYITNICEILKHNDDVAESLIEYCISHKEKSFKCMAGVAKIWARLNIKTSKDAEALVGSLNEEAYGIFKYFDVQDGNLENLFKGIFFLNKWTKELGFSTDVIKRACEVTVESADTVRMEYTNSVLENWHRDGIKSLSDIEKKNAPSAKADKTKNEKPKTSKNNKFKFSNQREYDFCELERMLFNK